MSIQVVCEECGANLRVDEEKAGSVLRCKYCGADVDVPTGRRVPWGVWAGIGGGVAVGLVGVIFLATPGNREQPNVPAPPRVAVQPEPPPPPKAVIGHVPAADDGETLEDHIRKAKEYQEAVQRKDQEELALFKKRAEWDRRFRALMGERQTAFAPLIDPLENALIKAALQASDARDEKRRERLAEERNAFAQDRLQVSKSPEVRDAALKYAEGRLELERQFVKQLADLKAAMPKGVGVGDQRTVASELAAAEAGARRMEAVRTELAALPVPKPPAPDPKTAVAAQEPKEQPPETPERKEAEFLGPAPADWSVEADPPKEKLEFPKQLSYALDVSQPQMMLYPPGRTAFAGVGLGPNAGLVQGFSVVDVRTGKAVGRATGIDVRLDSLAVGGPVLSPDGTYLAMHDSGKKKVLVGNLKARKGAAMLDYDSDGPALVFPTANQVLALPTSGKKPAKLWELPNGKELRSFPTVESPSTESGRMSCSPGGRFLAFPAEGSTPHDLHFYDLTTGKKAGTLKAPGGGRSLDPYFVAVAFSPDGSELAAFVVNVQVGMNAGEAMACWDVKTGRPIYYRFLDRGEGRGALFLPTPEPLQWFPDGKGWLLFQRYVVDREAGAVVQGLKAEGDMFAHFGTKVLDDRRVLMSLGGKMKPFEVKRFAADGKKP